MRMLMIPPKMVSVTAKKSAGCILCSFLTLVKKCFGSLSNEIYFSVRIVCVAFFVMFLGRS